MGLYRDLMNYNKRAKQNRAAFSTTITRVEGEVGNEVVYFETGASKSLGELFFIVQSCKGYVTNPSILKSACDKRDTATKRQRQAQMKQRLGTYFQ